MIIQFELQDLMTFVLSVLGIASGILLLLILLKVKKVATGLQSLIETNKEFINRTIDKMPEIVENVRVISIDIREMSDKLKGSVPVILNEIECVTSSAKVSIESIGDIINDFSLENNDIKVVSEKEHGFMAYVHIAEEILQIIVNAISYKGRTKSIKQGR